MAPRKDRPELENQRSSPSDVNRPDSRDSQDHKTHVNDVSRSRSFDLEEWESGITRVRYNGFISTLTVNEREDLYQDVLQAVLSSALNAKCLLVFASFDPHRRLVCAAVKDYLNNRIVEIEDTFAGVHELIEILADNGTANRGAILAGLVSIGDRRINAIARAARHLLSSSDVKNFSGVHQPELRPSYVEFCLDWLIDLTQNDSKEYASDIAVTLMLMVVHDERGVVEELSGIEYAGLKKAEVLQTKTFESYYSEIRPILDYLQECDGFELMIGRVIEMWDEHQAKAKQLRKM
jgi:hypothetical protein